MTIQPQGLLRVWVPQSYTVLPPPSLRLTQAKEEIISCKCVNCWYMYSY